MIRRRQPGVPWGLLLALFLVTVLGLLVAGFQSGRFGAWLGRDAEPNADGPRDSRSSALKGGAFFERDSLDVRRERFRTRLVQDCGVEISPEELASLAHAARAPVEARLAQLAQGLDARAEEGGPDWRRIFLGLLEDRPETVEATLEAYRREVAAARAFVNDRQLVTLPDEDVEVIELRNPALKQVFSLAMYLGGRLAVTTSGASGFDSSLDGSTETYLSLHCAVCIPPLAVHETYPGHHVAFSAAPPGEPKNLCFHEGWGQYSELLMLEQGYYENEPARELGAWRLVLLRVLRASVDARLLSGDLSPEEAAELYCRELLLDPEAARAEVRRHLAEPGLKAEYLVGLLQLLALRQAAFESDPELTLKDFHDRVLAEPGPLFRVASETFGVKAGKPRLEDLMLLRDSFHD